MKISKLPLKGTSDWLPQEYKIRKYIFDIWRNLCLQFGFEEYLTPIIEPAEIYRVNSGEDVGGKELMTMKDRGGREVAIRPEMTPSVTRMVSRIYNEVPKPIKLFSITNFLRNEKPQRGRNREFWQLNFDIFGSEELNADIEVIQIAIEIMKAFKANSKMFVVCINDRRILNSLIKNYLKISDENIIKAVRILDKSNKVPFEITISDLKKIGSECNDFNLLSEIISGDSNISNPKIKEYLGAEYYDLENIINELTSLGYEEYLQFKPGLARGFDYYDGMIFEVFDKNDQNNRSMFGGGRYNGLGSVFGGQSFSAVGCAPGDETIKLFLESWGLLPSFNSKPNNKFYIPVLDLKLRNQANRIAKMLRNKNNIVELSLSTQKIAKALEYANKKGFSNVIIFGEDEEKRGVYKVKDMIYGDEKEFSLEKL